MTFKQAQSFVLPFTKHKGETLDECATTDEGLKFLDWLVGQEFIYGKTKDALQAYLGDPSIKKELEALR